MTLTSLLGQHLSKTLTYRERQTKTVASGTKVIFVIPGRLSYGVMILRRSTRIFCHEKGIRIVLVPVCLYSTFFIRATKRDLTSPGTSEKPEKCRKQNLNYSSHEKFHYWPAGWAKRQKPHRKFVSN